MPRPNFLIFMPDQLRADCVGCFGNPLIHTPNIDALASRGVRFDNSYVNHPVCSPSRVNLMTGWYPHTRGHRTLTHLVQPHEPNLLKYLKDGGYQVAWAGARGDVFAPGVTEMSTHFCGWTQKPEQRGMGPQHPAGSALYNAFFHGVRESKTNWIDFDEATTLTALDWLGESPAGPWCLWMPLIFPHLPFEVESPWYERYRGASVKPRINHDGSGKPAFHEAIRRQYGTERLSEDEWQEITRVYYGMVSRVDDQLGRVIEKLNETEQLDNTIVIFLTDHGEYLGDFSLVEKWPSGMDRCLVQNPLIFAGPGIAEGRVANTFAEMVDILPTLLELANIESAHTHFGQSLAPALSDPSTMLREECFSEGGFDARDAHLFETSEGPYKNKTDLEHNEPKIVGKAISLRDSDYTYVYRLYEDDELYDRSADLDETINLIHAGDKSDIANAMRARVTEWLLETSDVIPWEPDPRFPKVPMGQHDEFHF